jgi:hypothetical protein
MTHITDRLRWGAPRVGVGPLTYETRPDLSIAAVPPSPDPIIGNAQRSPPAPVVAPVIRQSRERIPRDTATHISDRTRWGAPRVAVAQTTVITRPTTALPMIAPVPHTFVSRARRPEFSPSPATAPVTRQSAANVRDAHYRRGFDLRTLAGAQTIAVKLDRAQHRTTTANPSSDDLSKAATPEAT